MKVLYLSIKEETFIIPKRYQTGNRYDKKTNLEFLQYRENPVTAHTFRHAFAIMAVEQGNAIYII